MKPEIGPSQISDIDIIVVSARSFQTSEAVSAPIVIETSELKPTADLEITGETAAGIAAWGSKKLAESLERLQ